MSIATNTVFGNIVLNGDLTGNAQAPEIRVTGVVPGTYVYAEVCVDSKGRLYHAKTSRGWRLGTTTTPGIIFGGNSGSNAGRTDVGVIAVNIVNGSPVITPLLATNTTLGVVCINESIDPNTYDNTSGLWMNRVGDSASVRGVIRTSGAVLKTDIDWVQDSWRTLPENTFRFELQTNQPINLDRTHVFVINNSTGSGLPSVPNPTFDPVSACDVLNINNLAIPFKIITMANPANGVVTNTQGHQDIRFATIAPNIATGLAPSNLYGSQVINVGGDKTGDDLTGLPNDQGGFGFRDWVFSPTIIPSTPTGLSSAFSNTNGYIQINVGGDKTLSDPHGLPLLVAQPARVEFNFSASLPPAPSSPTGLPIIPATIGSLRISSDVELEPSTPLNVYTQPTGASTRVSIGGTEGSLLRSRAFVFTRNGVSQTIVIPASNDLPTIVQSISNALSPFGIEYNPNLPTSTVIEDPQLLTRFGFEDTSNQTDTSTTFSLTPVNYPTNWYFVNDRIIGFLNGDLWELPNTGTDGARIPTIIASGFPFTPKKIYFFGSKYYFTEAGPRLWRSDQLEQTPTVVLELFFASEIMELVRNGSTFVTISSDGRAARSTTGDVGSWTVSTSLTSVFASVRNNQVASNGNTIVVLGSLQLDNGVYYTSTDNGVSWTTRSTGFNTGSVDVLTQRLVFVPSYGFIITYQAVRVADAPAPGELTALVATNVIGTPSAVPIWQRCVLANHTGLGLLSTSARILAVDRITGVRKLLQPNLATNGFNLISETNFNSLISNQGTDILGVVNELGLSIRRTSAPAVAAPLLPLNVINVPTLSPTNLVRTGSADGWLYSAIGRFSTIGTPEPTKSASFRGGVVNTVAGLITALNAGFSPEGSVGLVDGDLLFTSTDTGSQRVLNIDGIIDTWLPGTKTRIVVNGTDQGVYTITMTNNVQTRTRTFNGSALTFAEQIAQFNAEFSGLCTFEASGQTITARSVTTGSSSTLVYSGNIFQQMTGYVSNQSFNGQNITPNTLSLTVNSITGNTSEATVTFNGSFNQNTFGSTYQDLINALNSNPNRNYQADIVNGNLRLTATGAGVVSGIQTFTHSGWVQQLNGFVSQTNIPRDVDIEYYIQMRIIGVNSTWADFSLKGWQAQTYNSLATTLTSLLTQSIFNISFSVTGGSLRASLTTNSGSQFTLEFRDNPSIVTNGLLFRNLSSSLNGFVSFGTMTPGANPTALTMDVNLGGAGGSTTRTLSFFGRDAQTFSQLVTTLNTSFGSHGSAQLVNGNIEIRGGGQWSAAVGTPATIAISGTPSWFSQLNGFVGVNTPVNGIARVFQIAINGQAPQVVNLTGQNVSTFGALVNTIGNAIQGIQAFTVQELSEGYIRIRSAATSASSSINITEIGDGITSLRTFDVADGFIQFDTPVQGTSSTAFPTTWGNQYRFHNAPPVNDTIQRADCIFRDGLVYVHFVRN